LQDPDTSHWLDAGGPTSFSTLNISMLLLKVLKQQENTLQLNEGNLS